MLKPLNGSSLPHARRRRVSSISSHRSAGIKRDAWMCGGFFSPLEM